MNQDGPPDESAQLAPPARFTRETTLGCVGLMCILLTVPLLWLAVGLGGGWLAHVLPLLAFASAIGGAALTLRVPAVTQTRSHDPLQPVTRSGAAPTLERPSGGPHRLMWWIALALALCAALGYGLEVITGGSKLGLALMFGSGAALLAQGALASYGILPTPALHWLRIPLYGLFTRQSALLVAVGFVTIAAAMFLALLDGYLWGLLGLGLLVVTVALLTPLARSVPGRRGQAPTRGASNSRDL